MTDMVKIAPDGNVSATFKVYNTTIEHITNNIMMVENYLPEGLISKDDMTVVEQNRTRRFTGDASGRAQLDLTITHVEPYEIGVQLLLEVMIVGQSKGDLKWVLSEDSDVQGPHVLIAHTGQFSFTGLLSHMIQQQLLNIYPQMIQILVTLFKQSDLMFYKAGDTWVEV